MCSFRRNIRIPHVIGRWEGQNVHFLTFVCIVLFWGCPSTPDGGNRRSWHRQNAGLGCRFEFGMVRREWCRCRILGKKRVGRRAVERLVLVIIPGGCLPRYKPRMASEDRQHILRIRILLFDIPQHPLVISGASAWGCFNICQCTSSLLPKSCKDML